MGTMMTATALLTSSPTHACAPAQLGADVAQLPAEWRRALDALVAATREEGQPWSCPDARVSLVLRSDLQVAELVITDANRAVRRRRVASPADVVPLGEAMLARVTALPEGPAPRIANDNGDEAPTPALTPVALTPTPAAPPHHGAELRLAALTGPRFSGPLEAVWMSATARAVVAQDAWSAGLWGRYNGPVAVFHRGPLPDQFAMSEMTFGLTGGYRVLKAPVELTVAIEPVVAVVIMSSLNAGEVDVDTDAKVDFRLGGRLDLAIPIPGWSRLRPLIALDGELAPGALFGDDHSRWVDHRLRLPVPAYTLGLSVGMEITAIR